MNTHVLGLAYPLPPRYREDVLNTTGRNEEEEEEEEEKHSREISFPAFGYSSPG